MKPRFFAKPADFRAWLEAHHATAPELVVGFHRKATGKPSLTWPESVDEALCFGWIDGIRRSLDETAYTIRFTPRKRTSHWSAINVGRVAELEKLGKMRPAGRAAFAARTPERTGIHAYERTEIAVLPAPQEKALRANRKAAAFFDAQPPGYRRDAIHWVISAKLEETRERRLAQLIEDSAAGRRLARLTPPGAAKRARDRAQEGARRR
jgi:uncharacterized protein YdeI (YjbR/CyaY-like superfamily)